MSNSNNNNNWETARSIGMSRYTAMRPLNNVIKNYLKNTKVKYAIMGGKAAVHTIAPIKKNIQQSKNYNLYVQSNGYNKIIKNFEQIFASNQVMEKAVAKQLKLKNGGHHVVQFVLLNSSGRPKVNKNTGTWNSIIDIHASNRPIRIKLGTNGLRYISNYRLIKELSNVIKNKGTSDPKYIYRKQRLNYLTAIKAMKKRVRYKRKV